MIGGYEPNTRPFGDQGIPGDFVRQLLPENIARFEPLAENAAKVTPIVNEVGVRQFINGPIPYSADGDFVMGRPPGYDNLLIATGFLYGIAAGGGAGEMIAEWILEGRPSLDLWPLDIRRFGAAPWREPLHVSKGGRTLRSPLQTALSRVKKARWPVG